MPNRCLGLPLPLRALALPPPARSSFSLALLPEAAARHPVRANRSPLFINPQARHPPRHAARLLSTSAVMAQPTRTGPSGHPIFSPGSDAISLARETQSLLRSHPGWHLSASQKGLERTFVFPTFKTTWHFMNLVAAEAVKAKHHPEWSNVYNRVHIRWTTHRPNGLSAKDVEMCRVCDQLAKEMGEKVEEKRSPKGDREGERVSEEAIASDIPPDEEVAVQELWESHEGQDRAKATEKPEGLRGMTDRMAEESGDCCGRKTG